MKKQIIAGLIAVFAFALTTNTYAQNDEGFLGIRVGAVISKQKFEQGNLDSDIKSKFGLDLAAVLNLPLGDFISLNPEVHWVQKGAKYTPQGGNEIDRKINELDIPVLLTIKFGKPLGLRAFAGPSVNVILSAKDDDVDIIDDFKTANFGGVLGAGLALGPVILDVRYNVGFGKINKDNLNNLKVTTREFGAGLTFMF